ncbi:hypothetical protein [Haloplanus pelagicus]|jgi:F0F1-type ATP synthase membrane subunit c/vacuolar-type H+-ATPase subunit K|uniref:hypothetical protein n=1 Tax=Haloplanus pelagicus TaxID=2949995 RepID=UPI00203C179A|nr:hypothetical protein [Haloplanus sp. HW8-1]
MAETALLEIGVPVAVLAVVGVPPPGRTARPSYFVLRVVGVTVLLAGAALAVGVGEAVAAFFVGMAFSATAYAHDQARSPRSGTSPQSSFRFGSASSPTSSRS